MKPRKRYLRFLTAALALCLGACSAGADRSVYELLTMKEPDPPKSVILPTTSGDLKSKVKRDGYPDTEFVPNPERLPELSEEERLAMEQDLRETGKKHLENRVMTCGAEDPADCLEQ